MGGAAWGGAEPSAAAEPAATAATVVRGLPEGMCRAAALARRRRPLQVTLPFLALPLPLLSKNRCRCVWCCSNLTGRWTGTWTGSYVYSVLESEGPSDFHCSSTAFSLIFQCLFIALSSLPFR